MPFTPADATKYDKAASTPAQKRMWSSIANAVLKKHGDVGMAIRVANSKVESLLIRSPLLFEVEEPRLPRPPASARQRFMGRVKSAVMRAAGGPARVPARRGLRLRAL